MTTSKLVRRSVIGLLSALALGLHTVGRSLAFDGGPWQGYEMRGYGWPWIAYSGSVSWDTPMDLLGTGATPIYTHTAINAVQWLRSDPTFNASTLFLIPAACNIAWWGALIYLVHRALTPSPESAGRRGVPLRWSVRGLLLLQLLAAVAIGVGDRW